jgi:hypothetical protein
MPRTVGRFASRGQSITALAYLDKPLKGRYTSSRCGSSVSGLLAQLAEQLTLNQRVVGSSPTRPTKKNPVQRDGVFVLPAVFNLVSAVLTKPEETRDLVNCSCVQIILFMLGCAKVAPKNSARDWSLKWIF